MAFFDVFYIIKHMILKFSLFVARRGGFLQQSKTRIMEETFEDYLLKQLDAPVILKDGSVAVDANGNPLTKEQAIATNLINNAMKGDIKSIQYINLLKQQTKRKKK